MGVDRILSELVLQAAARNRAGLFSRRAATGVLSTEAGRRLGAAVREVGGIDAISDLALALRRREFETTPIRNWKAPFQSSLGVDEIDRATPHPLLASTPCTPRAELGLAILRTIIAAAEEIGKFDGDRIDAIYEHLGYLDLTGSEKAHLLAQFSSPTDLETLAAVGASDPVLASIICAAATLVIAPDVLEHRGLLESLARRLGLSEQFVDAIDLELASWSLESSRRGFIRDASQQAA